MERIERMNKKYFGDGVYVEHDSFQIRLYTDNGVEQKNEVFF